MYPDAEYYSVYEAGYCGYWVHENLIREGINNIVVNPADVPTKDKEKKRKTDPVDSRKLARELIFTPGGVSCFAGLRRSTKDSSESLIKHRRL